VPSSCTPVSLRTSRRSAVRAPPSRWQRGATSRLRCAALRGSASSRHAAPKLIARPVRSSANWPCSLFPCPLVIRIGLGLTLRSSGHATAAGPGRATLVVHDAPRGQGRPPPRAAQLKRWANSSLLRNRCAAIQSLAVRGESHADTLPGRPSVGGRRAAVPLHPVPREQRHIRALRRGVPHRHWCARASCANVGAGCPSFGGQRTVVPRLQARAPVAFGTADVRRRL